MGVKMRTVLSAILCLSGALVCFSAKVSGCHLTEGEDLVAHWPQYLAGTAMMCVSYWVMAWRRK